MKALALSLLVLAGCSTLGDAITGIAENYRVEIRAAPESATGTDVLYGATNTRYYLLEHNGKVEFIVTRLDTGEVLVNYAASAAGKKAWRRDGWEWVEVEWDVAASVLNLPQPSS